MKRIIVKELVRNNLTLEYAIIESDGYTCDYDKECSIAKTGGKINKWHLIDNKTGLEIVTAKTIKELESKYVKVVNQLSAIRNDKSHYQKHINRFNKAVLKQYGENQ